MQLERPLLQGKYSYLSKICLKQNMLCSHELYEVIETELVQDNLDPNAPEVMDVCAVSYHFKYFHHKLKINIVATWFDILLNLFYILLMFKNARHAL
jgi:hypothetical protein